MCKASVECYIPTSSHGGMMPIVGFGGYVKATDLAAAIARAEADADCWREGWAFAYSGSRLYGDDGELQDNSAQPFIDWRRDSAQEIRAKIQERSEEHTSTRLNSSH